MLHQTMTKAFMLCYLMVAFTSCSNDQNSSTKSGNSYKPIVQQLKHYVETNETFAQQLNQTFIEGTELNNMALCDYNDMYNFFNNILSTALNGSNVLYIVNQLLNYSDTPTGSKLMLEPQTSQWFAQWLNEWKIYLDSPNSTNVLESWYVHTNMSEFIIPPNGFKSFNDFSTRKIKPGVRPIAAISNNSIIVSPVDATIYKITNNLVIGTNDTFSIKNNSFNITTILGGDKNKAQLFNGGTLIQLGLDVFAYHRFHSCVTGYVNEINEIGGVYYYWPYNITGSGARGVYTEPIQIVWDELCRRGVVYINYQPSKNSNLTNGPSITIALVAVGGNEISSINFEITPGMEINKGDEIGYFAYGGSAIAILFPKDSIEDWLVKEGTTIQMGQPMAVAAILN